MDVFLIIFTIPIRWPFVLLAIAIIADAIKKD